jgi:hypothetical protein
MEHDQGKYEKQSGAPCNGGSECCSASCTNHKCDPGYCLVVNRNGYCTIQGCQFAGTLAQAACPAGSSCHLFAAVGGACLRSCDPTKAADCRGNAADLYGDYECRNWSGIMVGSAPPTPVALEPTCEPGSLFPCAALQASSIDCTAVGADLSGKTNPTEMACRKLDGAKLTSIYDPAGFCLDSTASGVGYRNPMPRP